MPHARRNMFMLPRFQTTNTRPHPEPRNSKDSLKHNRHHGSALQEQHETMTGARLKDSRPWDCGTSRLQHRQRMQYNAKSRSLSNTSISQSLRIVILGKPAIVVPSRRFTEEIPHRHQVAVCKGYSDVLWIWDCTPNFARKNDPANSSCLQRFKNLQTSQESKNLLTRVSVQGVARTGFDWSKQWTQHHLELQIAILTTQAPGICGVQSGSTGS